MTVELLTTSRQKSKSTADHRTQQNIDSLTQACADHLSAGTVQRLCQEAAVAQAMSRLQSHLPVELMSIERIAELSGLNYEQVQQVLPQAKAILGRRLYR
ncbi:MAG: hypothetical protein MI750_07855 [Xanthomonadales bacterium]|jgi:hypothetical protein|nr:hypothetical protein [Xanthomonadales bacterium]